MKRLILMRGLPGSGKSTKAKTFGGVVLSTDDYFMVDGTYVFNSANMADAHEWNRVRCLSAMLIGKHTIVIDNTNSRSWEAAAYVSMARQHGYAVVVQASVAVWKNDVTECHARGSHGVPLAVIQAMAARWQSDEEFCGDLRISTEE